MFATPTSVELAFGGRRQRAYLIRSDAGETELARLVEIDAVIAGVGRGELEPRESRRALRRIARAAPPFGPAMVVLAFALASAGAARFFAGREVADAPSPHALCQALRQRERTARG